MRGVKVAKQRYVHDQAVADLRLHPRNSNMGDVGAIAESIRENDFYGAVYAWEGPDAEAEGLVGAILAGNHRYMGAVREGLATLPTIWITCDATRAMRILTVDNATRDLASYDPYKQVENLDYIREHSGSLAGTGYDEDRYAELRDEAGYDIPEPTGTPPDDVPDAPAPGKALSATGDLWTLGPLGHRLLCGSSTEADDVVRLMDGAAVDLILTDPPYGVDYTGKTKRRLVIQNDDLGMDGTRDLVRDSLALAPLKEGGVYYVCAPMGDIQTAFRLALAELAWPMKSQIVWVKTNGFVLGRGDYHWRSEALIYGWRPGAAHYFVDDRTQDNVWEHERPMRSEEHPTMKPVGLYERAIKNSSRHGERVYDAFAGSGTIFVAAERTGRVAYGCELSPAYVDVILQRFVQVTGFDPVREDGTRWSELTAA